MYSQVDLIDILEDHPNIHSSASNLVIVEGIEFSAEQVAEFIAADANKKMPAKMLAKKPKIEDSSVKKPALALPSASALLAFSSASALPLDLSASAVAAPAKVDTGDADVDTALGMLNNNVLDTICEHSKSQIDLSLCFFTKAHGANLAPNAKLVHALMQGDVSKSHLKGVAYYFPNKGDFSWQHCLGYTACLNPIIFYLIRRGVDVRNATDQDIEECFVTQDVNPTKHSVAYLKVSIKPVKEHREACQDIIERGSRLQHARAKRILKA